MLVHIIALSQYAFSMSIFGLERILYIIYISPFIFYYATSIIILSLAIHSWILTASRILFALSLSLAAAQKLLMPKMFGYRDPRNFDSPNFLLLAGSLRNTLLRTQLLCLRMT